MANLDLTKYGITGTVEIVHNPSYEVLFAEETKAGLEGFEKGQETELGAVNVMTGIYTGRSPKDKFLVKDATSENTVWWTMGFGPDYPMEVSFSIDDVIECHKKNTRFYKANRYKNITIEETSAGLEVNITF